jgi:hypothetical protein
MNSDQLIAVIKSTGLVFGYIMSLGAVVVMGMYPVQDNPTTQAAMNVLTQVIVFSLATLAGLRVADVIGRTLTNYAQVKRQTQQTSPPDTV